MLNKAITHARNFHAILTNSAAVNKLGTIIDAETSKSAWVKEITLLNCAHTDKSILESKTAIYYVHCVTDLKTLSCVKSCLYLQRQVFMHAFMNLRVAVEYIFLHSLFKSFMIVCNKQTHITQGKLLSTTTTTVTIDI